MENVRRSIVLRRSGFFFGNRIKTHTLFWWKRMRELHLRMKTQWNNRNERNANQMWLRHRKQRINCDLDFCFGGEVGGCLKFWLDYWTKYLVCSMNKSRYLIFTAALRYLKNKIWKLIYNCSFFLNSNGMFLVRFFQNKIKWTSPD